MIRILRFALTLCALALALAAGSASADTAVGIRGGVSGDPDQLLIGIGIQPPPVGKNLYAVPSVEAGFGDDVFTLAINGDLEYQWGKSGGVRPYAGGGLTLLYADPDHGESDSEFGLSVLGGLLFDRSKGNPIFLELKLPFGNELPDFKVVAGIMFR